MSSIPTCVILSGTSRSGKSTLCQQAAELARRRGLVVGGVLTVRGPAHCGPPPIDAVDVRTGVSATVARYVDSTTDPIIEHWTFCDEGIRLGEQALRQSAPCDVLIIDEIGPLELLHSRGWTLARDVLHGRAYRLAIVAVRPSLLPNLLTWLEGMKPVIVSVGHGSQAANLETLGDLIEAVHDSC